MTLKKLNKATEKRLESMARAQLKGLHTKVRRMVENESRKKGLDDEQSMKLAQALGVEATLYLSALAAVSAKNAMDYRGDEK